MPAGGLAASGIGLLLGAGEAIWGAHEKKKYQGQIDALSANRPKISINPEEYDIQHLAESRAGQGMGASAKAQLQTNADRNLATLANASLMGGGDGNALGSITDNTQQAFNQNAIYDDQARMQNLSNLQNVWARQSANRDKQWQVNEYQPWKDKMTGLSGQLQGANNLFMGGLNMAGGNLMSLGKGLFGGGQSSGQQGGGDVSSGQQQSMYSSSSGQQGQGDSYGGSNLGAGGYTPFMLSAGMGGSTPDSPTDHESVFLDNNNNRYANAWR